MAIRILCIGDVVGQPGRVMLADHLKGLIEERGLDLVVCNAENIAGGSGITPQMFKKLCNYGVDVITLGDHVYRRLEIEATMRESERIVRPANLSARAAGRPWTVVSTKDGRHRVAVACILGQLFMGNWDAPWAVLDRLCDEQIPAEVRVRVFDVHAEASSEKIGIPRYLDGRASVCFGTHTHVPTADAQVLPRGTATISDVGMTGPYDGILGRKAERVLKAFSTNMPCPFDIAAGDPRLCGAIAEVDESTGRALSIERLEIRGRNEPQPAPDAQGSQSASPQQ